MESIENMTLEEINSLNNQQLTHQYFRILETLQENRIDKQIINKMMGRSIFNIYNEITKEKSNMLSHYFFPGDLVIMHPGLKERIAKKTYTCSFSGARISPGSLYINYRPLIENLTSKNVYVLKKTINVEVGYEYNLPTTIDKLEQIALNMTVVEEYSELSQQMGGSIQLQKLKRRKK